jgi:hypothetical protein
MGISKVDNFGSDYVLLEGIKVLEVLNQARGGDRGA